MNKQKNKNNIYLPLMHRKLKANKFIRNIFLFSIIFIVSPNLHAQQNSQVTFHGFLEYTNTTWAPAASNQWVGFSGIHNRIDIHWYPGNNITFHLGLRNNIEFGSMLAKFYPIYNNYLTRQNGWMDLTFKLTEGRSYILYSNIDRMNFKWTIKNLEISIGRQRINWGINLIWNPNDIFNTYNYFNFDYIERPGSDAVLLQYYTGALSSIQVAAKLDKNKQLTAAVNYKFNALNYDFQIIGGIMNKNIVAGIGWAGQIGGAGFTGEGSYFNSAEHFSDSTGQLIFSIGANYTFKKGLYLNTSFIYNSKGATGNAGFRNLFEMGSLSPKTLTLARTEIFGEISYPFTPLIKGDFSTILNPWDGSAFLGPSLTFNLTENMELYVMGQLFTGKKGTEYGQFGQMYYMRLKWSF